MDAGIMGFFLPTSFDPPGSRQMHVLLLTVFVSLVLVAFFLTLYWQEQRGGDSISGAERDALLPLGEGAAESGEEVKGAVAEKID